jgi:hypothetical protein
MQKELGTCESSSPLSCAIQNVFFSWSGLFWVILRWVVDLYACLWIAGNTRNVAVWNGTFGMLHGYWVVGVTGVDTQSSSA